MELTEAKACAHFVAVFAQQIHDLPFARNVPDFLGWIGGGAGCFSFGCFVIEAACLHEVVNRLLEVPFAGVQIYIYPDARRAIA